MAKKTISVEFIKEKVNTFLLNSDDIKKGERIGQMILLETILHETGNYKGYGHLTEDEMKESLFGKSIGVNSGEKFNDIETRFEGCDDTRRFYN